MPKLWSATIEGHRREVREATLDAAAALVAEGGVLSLTMSRLAQATGIGRATLYKYFPDVEAVLVAWHERHVEHHLQHLASVRDSTEQPGERVRRVLEGYAFIAFGKPRHGDLVAYVHDGERAANADRHLHDFLTDLLHRAAQSGHVRDDVSPSELATYCAGALSAATGLPSEAAVHRLVELVLTGLQPPR